MHYFHWLMVAISGSASMTRITVTKFARPIKPLPQPLSLLYLTIACRRIITDFRHELLGRKTDVMEVPQFVELV